MIVFSDERQLLHAPRQYYRRGILIDHPEQNQRYDVLLDAAKRCDFEIRKSVDHGLEAILAVHDEDYVEFLKTVWSRRAELPEPDIATIVSTHLARPQMSRKPEHLLGQVGYYMADTSTPIGADSWKAIYWSAQTAISAALQIIEDGNNHYALCRPPGHHAYKNSAGGFCFINNTATTAQLIRDRTDKRVAVLDVDVHAGNGTQGIFYDREDVLTISIHTNPAEFFPYYAGYADECGSGVGEGYNVNFPLAKGVGDKEYWGAIIMAMEKIIANNTDYLVVALGLDSSESDPHQGMRVTTNGFAKAAEIIKSGNMPTLCVQEGGYLAPVLGDNLAAFLTNIM